MSEINELIARNAKMAYETGVSTVVTRDYYAVVLRAKQEERERIIELCQSMLETYKFTSGVDFWVETTIALIKGEQK